MTTHHNALSELLRNLRHQNVLLAEVSAALRWACDQISAAVPPWPAIAQAKKNLLPALAESLDQVRQSRRAWQSLGDDQREQHPEVSLLAQTNQNEIMKIILLCRESEQLFLQRGLVPASLVSQTQAALSPHRSYARYNPPGRSQAD